MQSICESHNCEKAQNGARNIQGMDNFFGHQKYKNMAKIKDVYQKNFILSEKLRTRNQSWKNLLSVMELK